MAPMFDNKYKLLARYENQVQEVRNSEILDIRYVEYRK